MNFINSKKPQNQQFLGLLYIAVAMTIFGLYPVYSHLIVSSLDPIIFAGLSSLIASFPLLILIRFQNNHRYLFSPTPFRTRLLLIALLTGIATLAFFVGTKHTSGINTSLLSQIEPLYSILLASLFLGEVIGAGIFIGVLLVVAGAVAIVFNGAGNLNIGDLLILTTPFFYQLSHIVSKKIIKKLPDNIIPAARLFYGGLALTVLGVTLNPHLLKDFLTLSNIFSLIVFALILRTLDHVLWYQGLKRVPLSLASAFIPLSAAVSFIGSVVILNEIPTLRQYIGFFGILIGLIWISFLHLYKNQGKLKQK